MGNEHKRLGFTARPRDDFDSECFRETGKWPSDFPWHLFGSGIRTKGLNIARKGLGDNNHLAKAAVRMGAEVKSIEGLWDWRTVGPRKKGETLEDQLKD